MKKILCIALAVVLCSAQLMACNHTEEGNSTTETKQETVSESTKDNTVTTDKPADGNGQAEATPENTTPADPAVNLIGTMTESEKREINTFISNFSETHCTEIGEGVEYNDFHMISFAYVHNLINKPDQKIIYNDILGKFGIEEKELDSVLKKYFGKTVPHKTTVCVSQYEIEGKIVTKEDVYEYADGIFWIPAASGESYEYFAIVTDMRNNGDGTYDVMFNEYWDEAHLHEGMQPEWYSYTIEEAATNCVPVDKGTAKVRKKDYNGESTYELISFKSGL